MEMMYNLTVADVISGETPTRQSQTTSKTIDIGIRKFKFHVDQNIEYSTRDGLIKQILKSSKDDSQNKHKWLEKPIFPSDCTFAELAADVYGANPCGTIDWVVLTKAFNSNNGYVGTAYWNKENQQLVIAHRGTKVNNAGALTADYNGIVRNRYTDQMNSASTFAAHLVELLDEIEVNHVQISFTGHSLGGWLAQVAAFTIQFLKPSGLYFHKVNHFKNFLHAHTVVFDSPGCSEMIHKLHEDYYSRYGRFNFIESLDITVYLSAPNLVNTCNRHLGTKYRIYPDLPEWKGLKEHLSYTKETHSIKGIVETLRSLKRKPKLVENWPLVSWPAAFKGDHKVPTFSPVKWFQVIQSAGSLVIDLLCKNVKDDEYKRFFNWANSTNQYDPLTSDFNSNGITLHYEVKDINKCEIPVAVFTRNEFSFIESYRSLNGLKVEKLEMFCKDRSLGGFRQLMGEFTIEDKRALLFESENESLVSVQNIKQLIRWFPDITITMKDEMLNCPSACKILYEMEMKYYLQTLKEANFQFTDSVGISDFINSNKKILLLKTTNSTNVEANRINNIMKQRDLLFILLSWEQILSLNKVTYVEVGYPDILIIEYSSSFVSKDDYSVFEQLFSNARRKIIIIVNENLDINIKNVKYLNKIQIDDLTLESQNRLLNKKFIKFKTKEECLSLNELIGDGNSSLNFLSSENLILLMSAQENVVIHDELMRLNDLGFMYVKEYREIASENIRKALVNDSQSVFCISGNKTAFFNLLENENEEEQNKIKEAIGTKIYFTKNTKGELFFRGLCSKLSDRRIYWIDVQNTTYLQEIYDPNFYMKRNFNTAIVFDAQKPLSVPSSDVKDTLIFENTSEENIKKCGIFKFFKNEDVLNKKIIFCEKGKADFDKYKEPVHLFCSEDAQTTWIRSRGDLDYIRDSFKIGDLIVPEEAIVSLPDKMVIIADEPGMGKSTTLTSLCKHMKSHWVIRKNLKDCLHSIRNLPVELNVKSIVKFLLESEENPIGAELLQYNLTQETTYPVFILFDGFDEIYNKKEGDLETNPQEKIIKLLKFLKTTKAKVWITTRRYPSRRLENSLSTFAKRFEKLDRPKQREFLMYFWQTRLSLDIDFDEQHKSVLFDYTERLLDQAEDILGAEITEFIGVPLQLSMLAELFQPDVKVFSSSSEYRFESKYRSLSDLYSSFIKAKYDIYLKEKSKMGLTEVQKRWFCEVLTKKHQRLAFQAQFPYVAADYLGKKYTTIGKKNETEVNDEEIELNRAGLIQSVYGEGEYEFIHRTFEEFFAANLLVKWLNKPQGRHPRYPSTEEFLLPRIFLKPEHRTIRLFMDEQLNLNDIPVNDLKLLGDRIAHLWSTRKSIFLNENWQSVLHVLAEEKRSVLVDLVILSLKMNSVEQLIGLLGVFNKTAEKSKGKRGEKYKKQKTREAVFHTVLYTAVEKGWEPFIKAVLDACGSINDALIVSYIFRSYTEVNDGVIEKFLLYLKSSISIDDVREGWHVINEYLNSIEECNLIKIKDYLNNTRKENGRSSLLLFSNEEGRSALYSAVAYNNIGIVNELLHEKVNVNNGNYKSRTPLHKAAKRGYCNIVKTLVKNGAIINLRDAYGMTPFAWACRHGHLEVVRYLADNGADCLRCDNNLITPLIHAAKHNRFDILKYLVETRKLDVRICDKFGRTALSWVADRGTTTMLYYLIEKAPDTVNVCDKNGMSPLIYSVRYKKTDLSKLIVGKGGDVNVQDLNGMTPLLWAVQTNTWEMVSLLMENGADVNVHDNSGEYPIQKVMKCKKLDIAKQMVEAGADISFFTKDVRRLLTTETSV